MLTPVAAACPCAGGMPAGCSGIFAGGSPAHRLELRPFLPWPESPPMEINPLLHALDDLRERTGLLRGYL